LKSKNLDDLPRRVRQRLAEREKTNEILVRAFQLSIVIMFLTLYFFAAKTGHEAEFHPVPYVLVGYIALSLIGLVWAIRKELPDWAVYCSILIDFGLLYSLMISFHYQYEQPASFILKAPTLLYVFIFISLRALRLEWKFVAAAGATAAAGWIAVVNYVITIDPQNTMITTSYVDYLTSNSILIGAEVDKIISILAVTLILTLVVNASSNLLITAVAEQTAANDLSRFFDKRIAQDIRGSEEMLQAGHGERRNMAVINIDIRGFSAYAADREPSDVMSMLSAYQGRVVPLLQDTGAVIDKFMGDGIMATIGMEFNSEKLIAIKAVQAAEKILKDNEVWSDELTDTPDLKNLKIGIGIAMGPVSFGAVGQGDRLEMTVIGAAVNTSAKLEKHNKTLKTDCIVSKQIWDMAVEEGYQGDLAAEFLDTQVEGIEELQRIAVLRLTS
jgi:adenylate cyclase